MAEPFVAEIRLIAGSYAPRGWALCNGQLLPISQNTALFALLGTNYGGDGKTTFALPNFQGSAAMSAGSGPGLTPRDVGESGGSQTVTLQQNQMPAHQHSLMSYGGRPPRQPAPPGPTMSLAATTDNIIYKTSGDTSQESLNSNSLSQVGGNLPHNNMQPFVGVNFIIALTGIFPQRP